jgi:hypothetical protein
MNKRTAKVSSCRALPEQAAYDSILEGVCFRI